MTLQHDIASYHCRMAFRVTDAPSIAHKPGWLGKKKVTLGKTNPMTSADETNLAKDLIDSTVKVQGVSVEGVRGISVESKVQSISISKSISPNISVPPDFVGKYEFLAVLGAGGMGVVYKARQSALNRLVAIKMLNASGFSDQAIKRFQLEAKAVANLSHANLIAFRDYGVTAAGQPYMVLDFIEGKTLAQTIKWQGQIELEKALDIFIQALKGLAHAHAHGLLHRDIKPSNIMIATNSNEVKIVDFGIAKALDATEGEQGLTQTGEIFGTPLYMSPEQAGGRKLDVRSDLYSMGCVMFEALTAVPPLMGNSALTTLLKHQSEIPVSLREASLGREFPEAIEKTVAALLAKNPDERYQSAQHLIADLKKIKSNLSGDPVSIQVPKVSSNRNRVFGLILIVGTGLALLLALISWHKQTDLNAASAPVGGVLLNKGAADIDYLSQLVLSPDATSFDFSGKTIGISMKRLRGLKKLNQLILHGTHMNADAKASLPEGLEILDLSGTDFSDKDLGNVPTADLLTLNLNGTNVSDEGLITFVVHVSQMVKIVDDFAEGKTFKDKAGLEAQAMEDLSLDNTCVTSKGLSHLAQLPSLSKLSLRSDQITDKELEMISQFPRLEDLDIRFPKGRGITENGIAALAKCRTLNKLSLSGVDDRLAAGLAKLHGVRYLVLDNEQLHKAGILELAKLHDLVQINFFPYNKNRKNELQRLLPLCTINPDKQFMYKDAEPQHPASE
jgi:serine/threonine protein kinase